MTSNYRRREIDGLRAVAILAVVGYHIGFPVMAGGYVGVDIFLVVSGYVIAGLLFREQNETGSIALKSFYARRFRRLLPGFSLSLLATILLSFAFLLPDEQISVAKSGAAAALFGGNIYSWMINQDYFLIDNQFPPFRHLWTLGVEEQFYIFFPVSIAILAKIGFRKRAASQNWICNFVLMTVVVSLGMSILLSKQHSVFAYLMPFTRAWEFGAGALLAMLPSVSLRLRPVLAILGFALIVLAIIFFDDATPYPSFFACLPVVGTMVIIASGRPHEGNPVGHVLASSPMQAIGRLSYGWYLWHWPLIAIGHTVWGEEAALVRNTGLAFVALVLAGLSWHFIERPILESKWRIFATQRRVYLSGALLILCCVGISLLLWAWALRPLPDGSLLAQSRANHATAAHDFPFCNDRPGTVCEIGADASAPAILLWGDSHAAQLSKGFEQAIGKSQIRVIIRTMGGCTPAGQPRMAGPERQSEFVTQCAAFNDGSMAIARDLSAHGNLRGVVIAGDWNSERAGWSGPLAGRLKQLASLGLRTVLVTDIPLMPADFVNCTIRRGESACALTRALVQQRSEESHFQLNRIAERYPDARLWSPLDGLCPAQLCPAAINGRFLYRNRNHLSVEGSLLLAPSALPMLDWLVHSPVMH
ncbi:MAG: peptidoglycan/LPS O-acetylase OafA/YrhL [Parasphingorhabdus sp.]|jgi:peptidoglycan/LPS O-acetylase OafA/YrhL|uniref:acyltransferase family protein n=1 Tax=Parasphingorhabdus sp. TaxID=2709688 RepID=UPI0039E48E44|tara:strand:- start:7320 stop:9257 length:1938 start_codon:yes stop_codon:yes gene_type:complete